MPTLIPQKFVPLPINNPVANNHTAFVVVTSSVSGLAQAYRFTEMLKRRWNIQEELYSSLSIALTEAVTNAMEHGNKSRPGKTVSISANNDEHCIALTVEDEGDGFDYRSVPNPTEEENLLKTSGRGVFLMRQLSDYVHFSLGGRRVKLLFYK